MVMGNEFMGIVEEVGQAVTKRKKGDRVVVPFPIACGHFFCAHRASPGCENSNLNIMTGWRYDRPKGAALFGYTDLASTRSYRGLLSSGLV
jgi:S-(hydroxymethyl)glutathione dehydrogenase/alcohol dehydrogenase